MPRNKGVAKTKQGDRFSKNKGFQAMVGKVNFLVDKEMEDQSLDSKISCRVSFGFNKRRNDPCIVSSRETPHLCGTDQNTGPIKIMK